MDGLTSPVAGGTQLANEGPEVAGRVSGQGGVVEASAWALPPLARLSGWRRLHSRGQRGLGDKGLPGFGEELLGRLTLTSCVNSTGLDVEDAKKAGWGPSPQGRRSRGKRPGEGMRPRVPERPSVVGALTLASQSCQPQPQPPAGAGDRVPAVW